MSFSPARLLPFIARLTRAPRYFVAYSGGVDSHVLLHALVQLRTQLPGVELRAVHVNHGLHPSSADWARHCVRECAQLGVTCEVRVVDARAPPGGSPEDAARAARYAVFAEVLQSGDILFTAHHQDDQAETLLLQLLRGAGPRGLAGMAELSRFGTAWLARPLLEYSRAALREHARAQQLRWIDDPSNVDTRFDRNYLRHEILPRLRQRWPAASVTLARSARHCAEAAELLEVLAQADFEAVRIPLHSASAKLSAKRIDSPPHFRGGVPRRGGVVVVGMKGDLTATTPSPAAPPLLENEEGRKPPAMPPRSNLNDIDPCRGDESGLSVSKLLALSPSRQRNVLRFWIEQAGLPLPQQRHLERVQRDVLHAAIDTEPYTHWPGVDVRRYRDALYALPPLPVFDASRQWTWNLEAPLHIAHVGTLTVHREWGVGLRADACAAGVRVVFRSGGERIRPTGRAHHATLKNLFQQTGVPPWRRERVPLLYIGAELAAVAGYWYAEEFSARADAAAVTIEFQPE